MKRAMRKTLLIIFSAVMILGFSMMFMNMSTAKALSVNVGENLRVENGASIRLTTDGNDAGLRFKAKMTEALYNDTIADGAYADADGTFGMIIVPESYVTEYEAQKESGEVDFVSYINGVKGGKMVNLTFGAEKIFEENGSYCYTGSIVNLYLQNYNVRFAATAYFYDGETYSYSTAGESRSVVRVASGILNGDYSEYEAAGVAGALEDYVKGGYYAADGYSETAEGTYVKGDDVYDTFEEIPAVSPELTLSESSATVKESKTVQINASVSLAADVEISYVSGDDLIATVTSSGLVTGVSKGETVITVNAGGLSKEFAVSVIPEEPEDDCSNDYVIYDSDGSSTATMGQVNKPEGGWYQLMKADPDTDFAQLSDAPGVNGFWNNFADFFFPTTKFEAVEGGGYLTFDFKTSANSDRIAIAFVTAEGALTERFYVLNPGSEWITFTTYGALYGSMGASNSCMRVRIYAVPSTDWNTDVNFDPSDVSVSIDNMYVHSYTAEDIEEINSDISNSIRGYNNVVIEQIKKDEGGYYQFITAKNSNPNPDPGWENSVEIFITPSDLTTKNMEISFMRGTGSYTNVVMLLIDAAGLPIGEIRPGMANPDEWQTFTITSDNLTIYPGTGASLSQVKKIRIGFTYSATETEINENTWIAIDNLRFVDKV